ncbi:hemagglutinin repeat-containing protein [Achromobacter aegrifaciens]
MSKLRSLLVWSVVFTQVWSPVLAQTLPISVDKSVPGAKPSVGVSNGVPVINIAPPSAGGVSNNRYTEFNVGPSGAVLNNSGGASVSQLAGQVGGNPMLGNQRAGTILNQVTAPNPSQLLGPLEVAGNRANVIVANPAGITCNGCGFLNADRATLTTGRPQVGPDGSIGFDIASGNIRIEGAGLNGTNQSQVDLLARTLEINAGVWADKLNVTAGAARVDYASGAVSAGAGEGAAPAVALDTAALGGMYANSVRLIGTEAGVGVNIGGHLVALTGDLQVTAAGDVRIAPRGTVQAAGNLRVDSGRDLAVQGVAQAAGATALTAARDVSVQGAVGAGGALSVQAGGDAVVGAQGSLRTQGALRMAAGKDISLSTGLLTSGQDVSAQSGRILKVAGQAAMPQPGQGGTIGGGSGTSGGTDAGTGSGSGAGVGTGTGSGKTPEPAAQGEQDGGVSMVGGVVSAKEGVTLSAGRDMLLSRQVYAAGSLQAQAGADAVSEAGAQLQSGRGMTIRAGTGVTLAGAALTDGALLIESERDLRLDGTASAYGGQLLMKAGKDLRLGDASRTRGEGVLANAGSDLLAGGTMAARGDIALAAGRDARIDNKAAATGKVSLNAVRDLGMGKTAQWEAEGSSQAQAGNDMTLAGVWRGNGGMSMNATGKLSIDGALAASSGGLNLQAGGDLSVGQLASIAAKGPVDVNTLGDLRVAGALSSLDALTLQAARDAAVDGKLYAARGLDLNAGQTLTAAGGSHLQSDTAMTLRAGQDLNLAGTALAEGGMTLTASRDLRVGGNALAYGGALNLKSGNDLLLGASSQLQGKGVQADAGRDLALDGILVSIADAELRAVRDASVGGKLGADGTLDFSAGRDARIAAAGQLDASEQARVAAAGNLDAAGAVRGNKGARLEAGGRLDLSGTAASANGTLDLIAGQGMGLSAGSQALAGGALQARAGGTLTAAGTISSLADLILDAASDIGLAGQNLATGKLTVQAGGALATTAGSRLQADGSVDVQADSAALAGTLVAGQSATLRIGKDLAVDGTVLAVAGALKANSGGATTLGSASALQAGGLLDAQAGGKLLANGTISGEQDITLKAGTDAELNGKTVANGTLRVDAGGDLSIGQAGLAQGSARLLLGAGQDLRIAGTAGTATGAGAAGGTLQAQAGRDLFIAGTATAGSPIVLGALRDIRVDGIATALEGGLTADAGGNLRVGAAGRMQAADSLNARAGADLDSDGVIAAGGGLTLAAIGDVRLGGLAAALGERAAGNASITAGRDLIVKQNGQLQAKGTLTAGADRDLTATGALSSVDDMLLAAARDARVDGTAATDANLTLTGRDIAVGAAGLAQAGRTLSATAQGSLQAAGRMLAGGSQSLTAGDNLTVDGTAAALQGNLSLNAQRGDIALGAASRLQAGGALTAQAGGALTALGSAAAEQGMTLRAGTDATLGGIAATQLGDLIVSAGRKLTITADGRLQSGAALDLSAGGALANAGVASAATRASLWAGATLDNTGSVLAGGDLTATAIGQLSNAGRFVAGVGADGALTLPGSITLTAGSIVHGGTSLAGKDLNLSAGGLNLASGKLSAIGKVALTTPGDLDSRNAVVQGGALDITAANLRNQGGKLTATGDAAIKLGGQLDNTGGLIAAAGNARIGAATLVNRDGTLAGRDLTVTATGAVDNRGGLIQADNALTLNAASLDNSGTLTAAGAPPKGVLGKVVTIMADRVNNQAGSIEAVEDLALTTKDLDNTGGEVASQGNARIVADTLRNAQGKLLAGKNLTVIAQVLQGLGTLQSAGDLSFQYAGSLNQEGNISSGRDLNLSIGGDMDNRARISAGRDLSITANSLNNQASGELLAGGVNSIAVTQGLTNAGLIDGGSTRITAGRVDNTGRIYGDAVLVQAGALVNSAGAGGGAVLASRGNMNLGVGSLVNRDHALVYAGADLRIGGALDAAGRAVGQAVSLLNASATIEAAGNVDISAASLRNQNDRYASVTVQVSSASKVYFTPAGTTDMYDAETNWLCDEVTPMCSKDPAWLDDDPERMFLLPSARYPASRYGPPFDYAPSTKGRGGETSPITPTYTPPESGCSGGDAADLCWDQPEKFLYGSGERIWSVFGVTPPSGAMPVWTEPQWPCIGPAACDAEAARRKAYDDAYAAYKAPHMALEARIREFNGDFNNRLVGTFTYYRVQETVSETRTVTSDPGKILSGGAMTLTGTVTNDKSQIAAGGTLTVNGPAINNIGAGGVRTITRTGTMTVTQARSRDRKEVTDAYNNTLAGQPIELPVGTSGGNLAVRLDGSAPGASNGGAAPGPVLVASVGLPGGTVVRSVSNPAGIPDSQLYTVNGRPDAPYVVATDPRFIGQRPTVSSDLLLDLLSQPGALPGTTIGGGAGSGGGLAGERAGQPSAGGIVNAGVTGGNPSGARLGSWDSLAPAGAKFLTPSGQPKRLGDGFYEQKLVSDQVLATTGQRFLESYSDNDSQYKALLAAGAQFARDNGIQLGVALTEAQQRQLTTDLVWLVEQTVTLPDGTTETVLVPQVYLLVREGDLKGDGTLMAGRNVKLEAEGDIANSGTIGAREATVMTAGNIVNQAGGLIQGSTVDLAAREDLTNLVSLIKGDNVALAAGRDIALTSTSASENFGSTWGTHISGVARVDAGNLNMQAGRDITLTAAQVSVKDDARLKAGRDIALETLTESHGESLVLNKNNRHDLSTSAEIGSTLAAGGNLTLMAGQDVNARAADVTAGKQLGVGAGRDINLVAGVETGSAYDEVRYKTKSFLSSKTTHTINSSEWEQAKASTFTGDTAVLMAGRDLTVVGSNVGAQKDLVMSAERDVNILPGQNAQDSYDYKMVKKSGFGAMGGFSYGTSQQTDWIDGKKIFNTASTVGSVEGDVLISAGNALNITGSNVLARQGDITLIGKEVNISAALNTSQEREFHEIKQTGLTLTASNPMVSAVQTGISMADAAGRSDNTVMMGLAGATTGLAAVNAYDAVRASAKAAEAAELAEAGSSNQIDNVGGVSIKLSLGTSKSTSTTDRSSSQASGSTIVAGRDLTIVAQGAGKDSDITVTGSNLSAGNNVVLKAEGDILLQAARNAFEQKTDSKSSSASIGIGYSTGGSQNGFTLELGASKGRGSADGKDESWTNSHVTAGNVLAIQSGGDTTLKGATGAAERIIASVGGNLLLESLQDSSKYESKNKSAGFGLSLCIPPYCVGSSSFSANASTGKMNSDFKSVTEQTGLWAGDGGFLIDVKNNTTLIGSVIASSDRAVQEGLNKLSTGTLVTENIKNSAKYEASQTSLGGGFGFGGGKGADSGLGTSKDGQVAGGASKQHGSSVATGSSGFGMNVPVSAWASGNDKSTTHSAISGGSIVIRDAVAQQNLTGMTAAETIAALNRDTSDTLNALKPIFDKEKIEAGFEIVSESRRQMGQFLANRAKELDLAKARAEDLSLSDDERLQATKEYFELESKWGTTGSHRLWGTAIFGAAAGNVTGATSQFVQAAAVNYLQSLGAAKIKELSKVLGGDGSVGNAALHTILGCAGAAAQSASCAAGGVGALSSVVLNKLLDSARDDPAKQLSAEDREARLNLVDSIVAGIAAAVDPSAAATAQLAAHIEAENNYLSQMQSAERNLEIQACVSWACAARAKVKWAAIDAGQDASFYSGVVAGVPAGLYDAVLGIVKLAASPLETYAALKSLFESDDVPGTVSEAMKQSYIERITRMEAEYQRAGASGSFNAGVEGGKLIFEVAALLAGTGGVVKGGVTLTEKVSARVVGNAAKAGQSVKGIGEISNLGRVESTYSAIKPGPLADNIAETFSGGKYSVITLEKDTVLYRAGASDKPLGQFFSSEPPVGVVQTRIDKAVLPEWPGGAKSVIDTNFAIKIPAGTKVYVGEVGAQGGFYVGGTQQIVVQKPWLINGVEVINSSPLK